MPFRRRMNRRRPRISRAILARKRRIVMRRPMRPSSIHYFKRTVKISDVTASFNSATMTYTNIAGAYVVSLDTLPNYTEFTNLYDQYKINGVKLSFVPSGSQAVYSTLSGTTQAAGFGRFNSAIDYDDSTTPANENVLLQYNNLRTTPGWKTHTRYYRPKVRNAAVIDTVSGALAAAPVRGGQWLSTSAPDVEHYGLKVFCNAPVNTATSTSITYSVYATLYLACKNVR